MPTCEYALAKISLNKSGLSSIMQHPHLRLCLRRHLPARSLSQRPNPPQVAQASFQICDALQYMTVNDISALCALISIAFTQRPGSHQPCFGTASHPLVDLEEEEEWFDEVAVNSKYCVGPESYPLTDIEEDWYEEEEDPRLAALERALAEQQSALAYQQSYIERCGSCYLAALLHSAATHA